MRGWIWVGIALLERLLFLCILETYFLIPLNVTCRALVFFLAGKHFSQTFLLLISERSIRASSLQRNCVYPILLLALLLLTVVTGIYIYFFQLRSLSFTFMSNSKHDFVPRDQVSHLLVVYCSLFLHTN